MTEAAPSAEPVTTEETIEQIGARIFADDAAPVAPVATEPVPEPTKDPVQERASARILANLAADKKAAKIRADLAAERAAVAAQRSEVGDLAKLADAVKAAKGSPSKALELLGMTPKEFLETLATEHEPEAVAKRAVEGTLTEVQKLKAELDAMKAERVAERRQIRERELAIEEQATGSAFVEFVASNADKYPNLTEVMEPSEFVQAGFALLHEVLGKDEDGRQVTRLDAWMAEHGAPPGDDVIAEALEERAAPRAKARSEWRARIGKNAPAASTATPSAEVRATQMDRGPSPRTLTSRAASEKAAAAPAWSQEAADEESLRIIRAALSG